MLSWATCPLNRTRAVDSIFRNTLMDSLSASVNEFMNRTSTGKAFSQSLQGLYSWVKMVSYWLLSHDRICASAGALSGSQCIGEGWVPGWRLVTYILLFHSFSRSFRPLAGNYFFQLVYVFARGLRSLTFRNFSVLYMEVCDQSLYGRLIPVVHLLCVSSLMFVPSFYLWLNFKRKFQTSVEIILQLPI